MAPGALKGLPFMSSGNHSSAGTTMSAMRAPPGQLTLFRCGSIDQG